MKTFYSFKTQDGTQYDVAISAKNIGTRQENGEQWKDIVYKHRVTATSEGNKVSFVFYSSINDYISRKSELDEDDLKHALYCLVSDGIAGNMSFDEFCGEFGYDTNNRKSKQIWKSCQKQTEKANKLFHDLYEVANAINQ